VRRSGARVLKPEFGRPRLGCYIRSSTLDTCPRIPEMEQPTITFDGVEIPDLGDQAYPYGVIEVTRRCNSGSGRPESFDSWSCDFGAFSSVISGLSGLESYTDSRPGGCLGVVGKQANRASGNSHLR